MRRTDLIRRIINSTRDSVRGETAACARLAYLLARIHDDPATARIRMHVAVARLWPKRMLWRYITIPYLKRFHPHELAYIARRIRSVTRV